MTNPTRTNSTTQEFPVIRRSIGETFETRSGLSVTVQNPRLAKAVVINQHTSPVGMAPDSQFVIVDVVTDKPSDSDRTQPRYIGADFRSLTDREPARSTSTPLRETYHPPESGQPVGVPVAVAPADTASVAWVRGLPESVVWTLPSEITAGLATAASFAVESVAATDESDPELTLVVSNTGGRDDTFYANVHGSKVQDDNQIIGFRVPAGETVTHAERPGINAPPGQETRVVVDWSINQAALAINPE